MVNWYLADRAGGDRSRLIFAAFDPPPNIPHSFVELGRWTKNSLSVYYFRTTADEDKSRLMCSGVGWGGVDLRMSFFLYHTRHSPSNMVELKSKTRAKDMIKIMCLVCVRMWGDLSECFVLYLIHTSFVSIEKESLALSTCVRQVLNADW